MLNLGLVAALVVVGLAVHSLAVKAADADYLAAAAAIAVSLLAIFIASHPRGHPKATTVAALVNGGWLLIVNIVIIAVAIQHLNALKPPCRWPSGADRRPIAAVVVLAGVLIFGGDDDDDDGTEDLRVKTVLLDTAA